MKEAGDVTGGKTSQHVNWTRAGPSGDPYKESRQCETSKEETPQEQEGVSRKRSCKVTSGERQTYRWSDAWQTTLKISLLAA